MRIIIVEDQKKLALSLQRGLGQNGYAADTVFDGEAALNRLEHHHDEYDLVILDGRPDMIVLDINMPKMDGMTVCKALRAKNIFVPILMLTAKDTVEDRIQGLDAGADDYLIKPFSFEELLARVRALLRRPQSSLTRELKIKDLTLNTVTRKVFQGKKEILLTLKEFSILEYFMRNPNQVLTRDQILSHVWDFSFDSLSNVVDVHLKNLRKKLETHKHEAFIETVHGVGYRLKN